MNRACNQRKGKVKFNCNYLLQVLLVFIKFYKLGNYKPIVNIETPAQASAKLPDENEME